MKRYYLLKIFAFILCIGFTIGAQNFKQVTHYTYPTISDAYFINSSIGWFVSSGGDVRKTVDGGETWTKLSTNITDNLTNVYFLNENIGYAGNVGSKIFKTTDGGTNWTAINVTGGESTIYKIYFYDENQGWLLTSSASAAKVLRTTDGGTTWNIDLTHSTGDMESMAFIGNTNGIICGGGVGKLDIYYTTNGINWTKAPAPALPPGYTRTDARAVYMVDVNLAYSVGWGSTVGSQPSILLKSTTGGATWTYLDQSAQNRVYDNLWAVYFKNANDGIAIGGATRGSVAIRTNDGGTTWGPIEIPSGVSLSTINGFGDELVVSGSSGVILKTTDFGNTWQSLTPMPNGNVNSFVAVNDNVLYAGGFNAVFFKSTNGGNTWKGGFLSAEGYAPNIQQIYFVNENVGYSAHTFGLAAKTTDGGNTWEQVIPITLAVTNVLYAPFFLDENYGFIVGKESNNVDIIYKTTNGGVSWESKTNMYGTNWRSIAFRDPNNGIVVGEKLKAAYTTDGGSSWTASVFNTLPPGTVTPNLLKVTYSSGTNAIAVGDQLILHSSNGGATWDYSPVTNLVESLSGVAFLDANIGWAVGSRTSAPRSAGVYYTSDAGVSWSNQASLTVFDTMKALYDVDITPSGYVWIGSASTTIYTNSPLVGINEHIENVTDFTLNQNYPNPFNPSTKISWQSPVNGWQSLKIYDVLGNEISTLVNEYKPAGSYEVEFNSSQFASGIYFYRLQAGSFVNTKKMIYLK